MHPFHSESQEEPMYDSDPPRSRQPWQDDTLGMLGCRRQPGNEGVDLPQHVFLIGHEDVVVCV